MSTSPLFTDAMSAKLEVLGVKFVVPSDTVPDASAGREVPLKCEFTVQPGNWEWKWLFVRMRSPVPTQSRSTSTLNERLEKKSKHPSVAFNVAESSFLLTWKSWSANEAEQSAASGCVPVQRLN